MNKPALRIAVVENNKMYLDLVAGELAKAGHEVLPLLIDPETRKSAARTVLDFRPSIVFVDNDFGIQGYSGAEFAREFGHPPEVLISMSCAPQTYCARWFAMKALLGSSRTAKEELLKLVNA